MSSPSTWSTAFTDAATAVAHAAGRPATFLACCAVIVFWGLSGPAFGFSDTWQLIVNTGTTIVTFLMVFFIQNTQNRDTAAIQTKLDEILIKLSAPSHYIGIEDLTEDELEELRMKFRDRAKRQDRAATEAD